MGNNLEQLEDRIIALADEYEHASHDECDRYEETIKELLRERMYMVLDSNKMDKDDISKVIEFNTCIRNALTELYSESKTTFELIRGSFAERDIVIEPKLWIDDEFPSTRKDQTVRAKRIWEILLNPDLNEMYHDGCDNGTFDPSESLNHYLYLSEEIDDWNYDIAGLFDVTLPDNMHMVYAAHNLGAHTLFSIFELMHVRKFRKEIVINIEEKT